MLSTTTRLGDQQNNVNKQQQQSDKSLYSEQQIRPKPVSHYLSVACVYNPTVHSTP